MNSVQRGSAKEEIADGSNVSATAIKVFTMSMAVAGVGVVGDKVSIGKNESIFHFGWSQLQHPFCC